MFHFEYQRASRFENTSKEWVQIPASNLAGISYDFEAISVATFNILFGMPSMLLSPAIRTKKRFNRILSNLIPETNADILSLMEVTAEFIDLMLDDPFIQQNYYLSHTQKMHQNHVHEVVILSKFPFATVFMKDRRGGRYQYSTFNDAKLSTRNFILLSTHLWANEDRYESREHQLQMINDSLKNALFLNQTEDQIDRCVFQAATEALRNNNVIMLGDLNIHLKHEDQYLYDNGFVDLWREIHPRDDGYTWDPKENSMVRSIFVLDNRRMRLDRILMRNEATLFMPLSMKVLAKESIGCCLNYSDHFMLLVKLQINAKPKPYKQLYDLSMINHEKITGFRTLKQTIALRITALVLLLLIIIAAIAYFIFK